MGDDTKRGLATQPSVAKRTLIRAFESHIIAREQEDHGQEGDRQAPMTLLRNDDGTPRKVVIATTDRAFAEELHDAISKRVPVAVQLHRAPTDDELEALSKELPAVSPPPSLPPVPAKAAALSSDEDAALEAQLDKAMRLAPPGVDRGEIRRNALRLRELGLA